jgi:hypothetical protein
MVRAEELTLVFYSTVVGLTALPNNLYYVSKYLEKFEVFQNG